MRKLLLLASVFLLFAGALSLSQRARNILRDELNDYETMLAED